MSSQLQKVQELIELRAEARLGGGQKQIDKQHERGKYTARERIAQLVVMQYEHEDAQEVEELSGTERGSGGFGSTGVK